MIVTLIILILLIPYLIDIYVNGNIFVKRLKIGRWNNFEKWVIVIDKVSNKWIVNPPIVKKTDNSRLIILDILKNNYKNNTIQSWQYGLVYLSSIYNENSMNKYVNNFLSTNGHWKQKPQEVDYALLAYAILKDATNKYHIKSAMDEMYNVILELIDEKDQCILYRRQCKNQRYVDTVGFVTPFLALYGVEYNKKEAVDLAIHVIKTYFIYGFEKNTKLPFHAYDSLLNYPLGLCGWGRGTGWFLLGLIETYNITKDKELVRIISELVNVYEIYQMQNGAFSSNVQLKSGADSSITAVMAYFYSFCAKEFGNERYKKIAQKAFKYLMSVTRRNGEIDFSQGDTKGIGFYSQTFDIMPFTQGITNLAVKTYREIR